MKWPPISPSYENLTIYFWPKNWRKTQKCSKKRKG